MRINFDSLSARELSAALWQSSRGTKAASRSTSSILDFPYKLRVTLNLEFHNIPPMDTFQTTFTL